MVEEAEVSIEARTALCKSWLYPAAPRLREEVFRTPRVGSLEVEKMGADDAEVKDDDDSSLLLLDW
jgi:hypothetical protein